MSAGEPVLHRQAIADGWQLQLARGDNTPPDLHDQVLDAVVPGCVHTDLVRTGHLQDPDVGTREDDQHWIGAATWVYRTTIDAPAARDTGHRTELVFEGLDTHARVELDGRLLGETTSMHRRYVFDVTDELTGTGHRLDVVFLPIGEQVQRVREQVGELPATEAIHYPYVRKMACNFGWDWGPVYVTAGIWKPVHLQTWSVARLRDVIVLGDLQEGTGVLDVSAAIRWATGDADGAGAVALRVSVSGPGTGHDEPDCVQVTTAEAADERTTVQLRIPDAQPWWPVGMGEQPLYRVIVELLDADQRVLDRAVRTTGFRSVSIEERPDEHGLTWQTLINGQPVNIRGFNWIPDLPFPSAVDSGRYRRRIDQALAANANMLRIWGGGIYEAEDFYRYCDERGVLVWQDFLFACAAYPETAEYRAEVEAEARQAVSDRSQHPSLILWNANNECTWGYHDWGWQEQLQGRPWGAHYYGELLPGVLAELDPTRPYLPGSPSSGDLHSDPNDDSRGTSHLWDVWNEKDFLAYRDRTPSFAAEFGFCGPATHTTMRAGVPEGPLTLDNPVVRHHLRAADGPAKLATRIAEHFRDVTDSDDWHWLAQLTQARAVTTGVDHLRAQPRCSGAVVWQLNDCWPVISWAAVDSGERVKPLWYAMRSVFAPQRLSIQPDSDRLVLAGVNDGVSAWSPRVVLRRVGFDGTVRASAELDLEVPPAGVSRVAVPPDVARPEQSDSELLVVEADGAERATWFWERDKDLAYPAAQWSADAEQVEDGLELRVRAHTLLRDLTVFPDRLTRDGEPLPAGVVASAGLVTLLPGESAVIRIPGAGQEHATAVTKRPVLRCANDVGMTG